MDLNGKVALVTGSSSGIGESIVIKFASLGANVVVTGRDDKKIEEVVDKCEALKRDSNRAIGMRADLLNEYEVKNLVDETIKQFGRIDILVNNAGIAPVIPFGSDGYLEAYDNVMNTNVRSVQVITLLVVPHLIKSKGNIVNISSIASIRPVRHDNDSDLNLIILIKSTKMISYCMAKSALDMFTMCLALDLAPKGVRVNSVNPAAVETPILDKMYGTEKKEDFVQYCSETYPLGRIGKPEDVSELVTFLASERASFITGALIPVDGGKLRDTGIRLNKNSFNDKINN